jgi:hypothetical protein
VAGEAVDEVVLAAVGLVGDDDDVAPVREHGVAVAQLGGHELLDGREDDATAGDAELLAQIVSVGDDDDRRILHRRVEDQPPGLEGCAQAFA